MTYAYFCDRCSLAYDAKLEPSSKKKDTQPCPRCGRPGKRNFKLAGIHFKGSGFHTTDYGR